jgi:hypothetical protein
MEVYKFSIGSSRVVRISCSESIIAFLIITRYTLILLSYYLLILLTIATVPYKDSHCYIPLLTN